MTKYYRINKNEELIRKVEDVLKRKTPCCVEDKLLYYRELDAIEQELFAYKQQIFEQADEWLNSINSIVECNDYVVIIDVDIENALNRIMNRKSEIWVEK